MMSTKFADDDDDFFASLDTVRKEQSALRSTNNGPRKAFTIKSAFITCDTNAMVGKDPKDGGKAKDGSGKATVYKTTAILSRPADMCIELCNGGEIKHAQREFHVDVFEIDKEDRERISKSSNNKQRATRHRRGTLVLGMGSQFTIIMMQKYDMNPGEFWDLDIGEVTFNVFKDIASYDFRVVAARPRPLATSSIETVTMHYASLPGKDMPLTMVMLAEAGQRNTQFAPLVMRKGISKPANRDDLKTAPPQIEDFDESCHAMLRTQRFMIPVLGTSARVWRDRLSAGLTTVMWSAGTGGSFPRRFKKETDGSNVEVTSTTLYLNSAIKTVRYPNLSMPHAKSDEPDAPLTQLVPSQYPLWFQDTEPVNIEVTLWLRQASAIGFVTPADIMSGTYAVLANATPMLVNAYMARNVNAMRETKPRPGEAWSLSFCANSEMKIPKDAAERIRIREEEKKKKVYDYESNVTVFSFPAIGVCKVGAPITYEAALAFLDAKGSLNDTSRGRVQYQRNMSLTKRTYKDGSKFNDVPTNEMEAAAIVNVFNVGESKENMESEHKTAFQYFAIISGFNKSIIAIPDDATPDQKVELAATNKSTEFFLNLIKDNDYDTAQTVMGSIAVQIAASGTVTSPPEAVEAFGKGCQVAVFGVSKAWIQSAEIDIWGRTDIVTDLLMRGYSQLYTHGRPVVDTAELKSYIAANTAKKGSASKQSTDAEKTGTDATMNDAAVASSSSSSSDAASAAAAAAQPSIKKRSAADLVSVSAPTKRSCSGADVKDEEETSANTSADTTATDGDGGDAQSDAGTKKAESSTLDIIF